MNESFTPSEVLGETATEIRRLVEQSRLLDELTEHLLRRAGIEAGMRVLDVGCGAGDVSFLAGRLVGDGGAVLGVDRSKPAVALARARAAAADVSHVTFRVAELDDIHFDEPFDALVGRLVLPYVADPTATVRSLARFVRPGGIVVFQEVDSSTARSAPRSALFDKSVGWILTTLRRAGLEPDLGSKLYPLLRSAGFPRPSLLAGARVEGGPDSRAYAYVVETVRSLMPMMERLGIATSREIDIASLEERLRLEVVGGGGVVFLPSMVGAWARKPVPAPTAPEGGRTRL